MAGGKRIKILSKDEEKYLYDIPDLTNEERMVLFDLSEADYKVEYIGTALLLQLISYCNYNKYLDMGQNIQKFFTKKTCNGKHGLEKLFYRKFCQMRSFKTM